LSGFDFVGKADKIVAASAAPILCRHHPLAAVFFQVCRPKSYGNYVESNFVATRAWFLA
jgi:hypothetical protein